MSEWDSEVRGPFDGFSQPREQPAENPDFTIVRQSRQEPADDGSAEPIIASTSRRGFYRDTGREATDVPSSAEQEYTARKYLERSSAAAYNRAALTDPARLFEHARTAIREGDAAKAVTGTMALHEQRSLERQSLLGPGKADAALRRVWPHVASAAIRGAHDRIESTSKGLVTMTDVMLIDNLEPDSLRSPALRGKASELQEALGEAAHTYYDLAGNIDPDSLDEAYEDAIRAGFVRQRLAAAGEPNLRSEELQRQWSRLGWFRDRRLWGAAGEYAGSGPLPEKLTAELGRIERQTAALRRAQRADRIKGWVGHTIDYVIKHGLTDINNIGWPHR